MLCQLSPNADPNWILNTQLSDEFNSLDLTKWNVIEPGECCNWGGQSRFIAENVYINNGELVLEADPPNNNATPPYNYTTCCGTGGINSLGFDYHYGYLEIMAKLPGNFHQNLPNGQKFWPAFWGYFVENDLPIYIHDEIDILEPSGIQYQDGSTNVCGWHDEIGDGTNAFYKVGEMFYTAETPLFSGYHKYAVEWLPDRIIFYFDDIPYAMYFGHPSLIMEPLRMVIDLQIDSNVMDFNPSITWPQSMRVQYFRFYQLNMQCFNTTVQTFNEFTSINGVQASVNVLPSPNGISLPASYDKTIRSTGDIVIQGEFNVPIGSSLKLIPTPCY